MGEDKSKQQNNSGEPKTSPGERLDQFISGAKQFTTAARRKAKEVAEVTAPKIRAVGYAATQQASRALDRQRGNESFLGKAIKFYDGAGGKRKPFIWMAGGALIVFILLLPWLHTSKTSQSSSPTGSIETNNPYAGMDVQSLALLINERLIVGQGAIAESMWQTAFQDLAAAGYSTAALDIRNLQLAERCNGDCKKAIHELEKKLDPPKAH